MIVGKILAVRIREARKIIGETQDKFAEAMAVDRKTVVRWESGEHSPELATVEKIAEHTGQPIHWLFMEPARTGMADDRPPVILVGTVFTVDFLRAGIREALADPEWTEDKPAAHSGELVRRARERLRIPRKLLAEKVLGWTDGRLGQVEKWAVLPEAKEWTQLTRTLGLSAEGGPLIWDPPR